MTTSGQLAPPQIALFNAGKELTITEWMDVFQKLYEPVDSPRSPLQMWVAATAHFSGIGEAIRRMHFTDLMQSAAHAFCWMCSFVLACRRAKGTVFELTESFSDLVACKYPLVCKHCREKSCRCNPKTMDQVKNKGAHYRKLLGDRAKLGDAPDSYKISLWLEVFDEIYGQHMHMLTLESIGFHFLEEAGEELTAIRGLLQLEKVAEAQVQGVDSAFLSKLATFEGVVELYEKHGMEEPEMHRRDADAIIARLVRAKADVYTEFADTFSWFCSIINKVTSIAGNCIDDKCIFTQNAFYNKLIQEYLPKGEPECPSCQHCPCECVFYD